MTDTRKRMGVAAAIMMSSVFLSRILGYARDAVIAYTMGATKATDAYFAAFTIPDFLNYLVAGASLSITFIPIYTSYVESGRVDEGNRVFSAIFCTLLTILVAFIVLAEVGAEHLVPFIAPGFSPEELSLTAHLTRIVLPAQAFFYAGGLFMAVQYSRGKFLVPALAPLIYNTGIIAGGLLLGKTVGIEGFAWGVLGGSFVGNFLLQAIGAFSAGLRITFSFDVRHEGFREFIRLSIPIMLGFSLVFVDEWMMRLFGSFLVAGAITWLNNARRLCQVPIGILGQASGVASYPFLARHFARGETHRLFSDLKYAFDWVFTGSVLAGALLFLLSKEVVYLVFKRGAFTTHDAFNTGIALSIFSLGIPFWCGQNILARGYFAARDTLTPTIIGTAIFLLTLPLYYILMLRHGVRGLAGASTVGIFLHTAVLFGFLYRKMKVPFRLSHLRTPLLSLMAGGISATAGFFLIQKASSLARWDSYGGAALRMAVVGGAVSALYLALCSLLGVEQARDIVGKFIPTVRRT
ncbi:MAG: murein biosynthesis integral membrane protein MurJ [Deltaproteobacteria bacterium]|nr:MAG: murein biosynthesis integral membrane protein MurJ [Deltaproteobacteria bacterium]